MKGILFLLLVLPGLGVAQETVTLHSSDGSQATGQMTFQGIELGDKEVYSTSESWGKTWNDAEASEKKLSAEAGGRLVDHTARIDSRSYQNPISKRIGDDIPRRSRNWVVRMVHAIHNGAQSWSVGTVDPREHLMGKRVGYHVWVSLWPDGRVKRRIVEVWQVSSCYRCTNPTEGLVATERMTLEVPVLLKETKTSTGSAWCADTTPRQPNNITYVTFMAGQGPGPIMSPMGIYSTTPMAPYYLYRVRGRTCLVCPPIFCPGGPPALPPPPWAPPIGTPPNNDENFPHRGRG